MINLKPYPDNIHQVFTEAVLRKKDTALKARLDSITLDVVRCYNSYKEYFEKNQLELLAADAVCAKSQNDLRILYSFKSKVIKDLKRKIDDVQLNIISNTCQNCTINSVNTMDHVLGQALFPEHAVNPLNLFPSCGECNGYKSDTLVKDGKRKFLNLYLDNLPEKQYLFVDIDRDINNDLQWSFNIENRNGLDKDLFNLIKTHYESLYLQKRMRVKSIKYVTELINSINVRRANLSLDKICEEVTKTAEENRKVLGYNHFQYILETSLVQSDDFLNIV